MPAFFQRLTRKYQPPLLLLVCCLLTPAVHGQFDHGDWDEMLSQFVVPLNEARSTQVNYRGLLEHRDQLQTYLDKLSMVKEQEFAGWSKTEQLAFLINAYNAWTVDLVLTGYPGIDSIKDLGSLFRSPFSKKFITLFGETVSLDYIEHEVIRGPKGFGEPRIHFALNCASISCPALRTEAFTGAQLERQLQEATNLFLSDRSRNRLEENTVRVSEIFNWYEKDFQQNWRGTNSVAEFLALYADALELPPPVRDRLQANNFRIRYLNYDWRLNSTP